VAKIKQVKDVKAAAPRNAFTNHLNAVSEAADAFKFVSLTTSPPAPFIDEMYNSADLWINKILKDHKGEKQHMDWLQQLRATLKALAAFARSEHTRFFTFGKKTAPSSSSSSLSISSSSSFSHADAAPTGAVAVAAAPSSSAAGSVPIVDDYIEMVCSKVKIYDIFVDTTLGINELRSSTSAICACFEELGKAIVTAANVSGAPADK
jgi:hypothetical protein